MALRIIAISVAICGCLMLAAKWLLEIESLLELSALQSPSEAARPCLLSLDRCLDQAATPFTLCLVSVERCSGEGKIEKIASSHMRRPARGAELNRRRRGTS
jgi:hypothetical protein